MALLSTAASPLPRDVLRVLEAFMSDTAARLVLGSALESLGLQPESLTALDLSRLAGALGPASRHFVEPAARPRLLEQLRQFMPLERGAADEPLAPRLLQIRTEADTSEARSTGRQLCEALGGRSFESQKVATAISELARNQLMYAGGGTVRIEALHAPRKQVRVLALDGGPGIAQLESILSGRYRSKTGMGMGLLGVKRLANRFDVQTGPTGTRVEFEVWL